MVNCDVTVSRDFGAIWIAWMSLISFLASRIFKFDVLKDQETNVCNVLFVLQPDCIDSWRFVRAVLYST